MEGKAAGGIQEIIFPFYLAAVLLCGNSPFCALMVCTLFCVIIFFNVNLY